MASKKPSIFRFLKKPKNLKSPKFSFLFFFIFWSNFIQVILNFIFKSSFMCFVIFYKNALKESELCIIMICSSWVEILSPVLFAALEKPRFFRKRF